MQRRFKYVLALTSLLTLGASCGTPAYVGSRDCAKLEKELEAPGFAAKCEECQGKACEGDGFCKLNFPCEGGKFVVQGCEDDSDCSELNALCGKYIAQDHVCSLEDSI